MKKMETADRILQARNALALCESLLLEAFVRAPAPVAHEIQILLVSLTSDRDAIASLHELAQLIPGADAQSRKTLPTPSTLLD